MGNRWWRQLKTFWRSSLWILACISLLWLAFPVGQVHAHGGAIITDGYTEKYEWLAAINPYPAPPGPVTITLLVYDLSTHKAVTDLAAELYLAPPGSSEPCCQKGVAAGPFALTTDPVQWPGDYSTTLALGKAGEWQVKFRGANQSGTFEVETSFTVSPGNETNAAVPVATLAPDALPPTPSSSQPASPLSANSSNTGRAAVSNVAANEQNATFSSISSTPFGPDWWLWGVLALVPIVAVFVWGLRPEVEEEH